MWNKFKEFKHLLFILAYLLNCLGGEEGEGEEGGGKRKGGRKEKVCIQPWSPVRTGKGMGVVIGCWAGGQAHSVGPLLPLPPW